MTVQQVQDVLYFYNCPCEILQTRTAPAFTDYFLNPVNGTTINKLQARVADFSLMIGGAVQVAVENGALLLRVSKKDRTFYDYFTYIGNMKRGRGDFAVGITPAGEFLTANLFEMPHLLVAGMTGAGKSVFIHSLILSLGSNGGVCFRLIDLKRVELSIYNGCGFMVSDCITDANAARAALLSEVAEMNARYKTMEREKVDNYVMLKKPLNARVIIIDELADLMLNRETRKDVEFAVVKIAQLGRAAGIHLVLATQRPSREVITGLIKANIPAKIAFTTSNAIDSRVIGVKGAENLTGKGDALFLETGKDPQRVQTLYFSSYAPADAARLVIEKERGREKPKKRGFIKRLFG